MDPLAVLPHELLNIIFSSLSLRELATARRVCTTWRSVLDDDRTWRAAYFGADSVPSTEKLKLRHSKERVNWRQTCYDHGTLQYAWRSGKAKQVCLPFPRPDDDNEVRDYEALAVDATNNMFSCAVYSSRGYTISSFEVPSMQLAWTAPPHRHWTTFDVPGVGLVLFSHEPEGYHLWAPTAAVECFGIVPDLHPPADPPSYENFAFTYLTTLPGGLELSDNVALHLDGIDSGEPVLVVAHSVAYTVELRRFDGAATVETYTLFSDMGSIFAISQIVVDGNFLFVAIETTDTHIEVLSRATKKFLTYFYSKPSQFAVVDEAPQTHHASEMKGHRTHLAYGTDPSAKYYYFQTVVRLYIVGRNLVILGEGDLIVVCEYTSVFMNLPTVEAEHHQYNEKHIIGIIMPHGSVFVSQGGRFVVVCDNFTWIFEDIPSDVKSLSATVIKWSASSSSSDFGMDDTGIFEFCREHDPTKYTLRKLSFDDSDPRP